MAIVGYVILVAFVLTILLLLGSVVFGPSGCVSPGKTGVGDNKEMRGGDQGAPVTGGDDNVVTSFNFYGLAQQGGMGLFAVAGYVLFWRPMAQAHRKKKLLCEIERAVRQVHGNEIAFRVSEAVNERMARDGEDRV